MLGGVGGSRGADRGARRGGGALRLDEVGGIAALGELDEDKGPERRQGALEAAVVPELDRDRLDVRLAGEGLGGVELAAGQGRVAGQLAADLDPLAGALR